MGTTLTISSFIIRFVCTEPPTESSADHLIYHGMIRHIQSNQEITFTKWNDAITFIKGFVPLIVQEGSFDIEEESNAG